MDERINKVIDVDINEILPNRFQPRIQFDEEEILDLSDSIRTHGVIQPIIVRTIGDKYEIIAGERRYKASVLAGKESVPVIVKNLNDKDSAEIALIENIQRKNLTPIEEALSYKKILDMGYLTQDALATKLGKSQSSVANKIRLLNLSDEVQEALLDNKISERHARSILRLKSSKDQNEILEKIINERLTVRKTDEEIDKKLNKIDIKEEKGEENMNNEMNSISNIVVPNAPQSLGVFGEINQTPTIPTMEMPAVPPVQAMPTIPEPTPSMVGMVPNESMTVAPSIPTMEMPAVPPVQAMPTIPEPTPSMVGIVPNESMTVAPSIPTMEIPVVPPVQAMPIIPEPTPSIPGMVPNESMTVAPSIPTMEMPSSALGLEPKIQTSTIGGIEFDSNGNVVSVTPPTPVMPASEEPQIQAMPIIPESTPSMIGEISPNINNNVVSMPVEAPQIMEAPVTSPIQDMYQPSENTMPEPIIITDYSKQYDPVMPYSSNLTIDKVDFKEIINAVRECSNKIEKYGYKIDLEEYDLSTMYQVVFKIEK